MPAAKTAIRREERSKKALGDNNRSRNQRIQPGLPRGNGLASCVSDTAEDLASLVRRLVRLQPTNYVQYSWEPPHRQLLTRRHDGAPGDARALAREPARRRLPADSN